MSTASPTCQGTGPTSDIAPAATGPPESTAAAPATAPTAGAAAPSAAARSAAERTERHTSSSAAMPAPTGTASASQINQGRCPAFGTACRIGRPGSGPCTTPVIRTDEPSPTAKPGPVAKPSAQIIRFGVRARSIRNNPVLPAAPCPICAPIRVTSGKRSTIATAPSNAAPERSTTSAPVPARTAAAAHLSICGVRAPSNPALYPQAAMSIG